MKKIQVCFIIALTVMSVFGLSFSFAQEAGMDELDISLGELLNLDKVLVTATKHAMASGKAPAINTVITADEIRNMGARNISDVLKNVPGIGIGQLGSFATGKFVSVRGVVTAYSEKVLLLIDGNRVNESYGGGWAIMVFGDMTVENIKQIEIVRGPGSALYGTNAFAAVINVITKTADDVDGQQFTGGFASFETQHYNGIFSHKNEKLKVLGHVDYHDTDGPESFIERDSTTGRPGSMSPGYTDEYCEKWDAGLNMSYGDFAFSGRIVEKEMGPYIGATVALNDETVEKFSQIFGTVVYRTDITDDLGISMKLHADHFKSDILWNLFNEGFTGGNDQGYLGNPIFKVMTYSGEVSCDYDFGNHLITGGMSYEHIDQYEVKSYNNSASNFLSKDLVDVSENFNHNQEVTREIWAIYLQDLWEITEQDSLTVGVRYDYYDEFGGTTNPRAGYVHEFENKMTFKLLYGSAFRAPDFIELYSINNPVIIGNSDLEPEKIQAYEAGLEYPFLKHFSVKLNYFHNIIKNLIKPDPTGERMDYINVGGESKIDGIEAEMEFRYDQNRYGYINCSYQDGEDENGNTLPYDAHWKANTGFNYGFAKYLNANLNVSWVGNRIRAAGDTRDELSPYTLVDLTLIGKNIYKTLEIRGSVYNIFDDDSRAPFWDQRAYNDLPQNDRMFLFELRYTF